MKNLVLYLTINYPTRERFFEILDIVEEFQIGYVEIGIPVSDPYVDGSTVRKSQEKVFPTMSIKEIESVLHEIRKRYSFKVILMTYNEG
ncbi:tryptophan synthase subunit alpha, partial [Enterococcus avium]